ncbi:hypothetical protein Fmac_015725 [Flemingia macrophylla]|uniref:Uncharacterized protein n=1 Tax=Flemingia macrophylla TaxID=520843 RepID=A0ABD1MFC8_9FABA
MGYEFPFEICALEVLEAICSLLDARTREFETPGYVALDELTSKKLDFSVVRFVIVIAILFLGHMVFFLSRFREQYKNNVYVNTIQANFVVNDEKHKQYILGSLGKKWKDKRCRRTAKAMDIANKNAANRAKLVIPYILGSKTLARKRDELEMIHGREFSSAEMYQLSHKKPDGTFVNEEARELHNTDETKSRVCEKEHPGYVRSIGLGVSPSQIIGSSSGATSSTTSFESNERIEQMQAEIQTLKAQVAEIDSLKAKVAEVDVLKQQIAFLMQHAKGDETPDLESPVNKRSSEGSHMPDGGNSPATI